MEEYKWPIRISQLTSDSADYSDNNIAKLDGIGVIPNNHLRGLVQNINAVNQTVCTVYEIGEFSNSLGLTTGFYENDLLDDYCSVVKSLSSKYTIINRTIRNIFNNSVESRKSISIENFQFRFYPIECENKIIAILMVSDLNTSKILSYSGDVSEILSLREYVIKHNLRLPNSINHNLIKNSINSLETLVVQRLSRIRKNFINYHNREFIRNIRLAFKENNLSVNKFWKKIEVVLQNVIEVFPAQSLRVFTSEIITKDDINNYYLVASTVKKEVTSSKADTYFKIDNIILKNEIQTSFNNPELLKNIYVNDDQVNLDPTKDLVRVFPAPFASNSALIIWITYDILVWNRLDKLNYNSDSEIVFQDLIVSLYSFISSLYTSLVSQQSFNLLKKINKIDAHELSNLSMALELNRVLYLASQEQRNRLTPERFELLNDNFKTLIRQLKLLSDLSKNVINNDIKPKKKYFLPFGELLFKWKNLYYRKCLRKQNMIIFPSEFRDAIRSPSLFGDQIMIEAIIYNLLENAHKYSFRGTNITVDYFYEKSTKKFVFSFTNYSAKMSETRVIYKLFERGTSDLVKKIDGLGVGLFLCQKIAEAHGGTISHKTMQISKYNIPLMKRFLQLENKKSTKPDLADEVKLELERLESERTFEKVISKHRNGIELYRPPRNKVYRNIEIPTYKIDFKIILK